MKNFCSNRVLEGNVENVWMVLPWPRNWWKQVRCYSFIAVFLWGSFSGILLFNAE